MNLGKKLLVLLATLAFASAGIATPEEAVVQLIDELQTGYRKVDDSLLNALRKEHSSAPLHRRRLAALAVGTHYIEDDPRLALQFLVSADLLTHDDHPLRPIARYYIALAKLRADAPEEAARIAQELLDSGKLNTAWEQPVTSLLIEALHEAGQHGRLLEVFEDYAKKHRLSRRQEDILKVAAISLEKRGDSKKALQVIEDLAESYPMTEASRWAFRRLLDFSCERRKERYYFSKDLLIKLARNTSLNSGLKEFLVSLLDGPIRLTKTEVRTLDLKERVEMLFRMRFYPEALQLARELYEQEQRNPRSPLLARLTVQIGRTYLRLDDPHYAARFFSKFLGDYPGHTNQALLSEYLGDTFKRMGHFLAAAEMYQRAVSLKNTKQLRWAHFWNTYRAGDYKAALALLDRPGYVVAPDRGFEESLKYWRGRILQRLGRESEAKREFLKILSEAADGFYANLVAAQFPELLKEGPVTTVASAKPQAASETSGQRLGFQLAAKILARGDVQSDRTHGALLAANEPTKPTSPELALIEDLMSVGMREAATIQLRGLSWSAYDEEERFAAASRLAWMLEDYRPGNRLKYRSFSALRHKPQDWWSLVRHQDTFADEWKMYYPMAFERIVEPLQRTIGIDPHWALSIMRAESHYRLDARSWVGARGLMQIMPYTGIKLAQLLGDDDFQVVELGEPEVNVAYGAYYLQKLYRYYGGNMYLATAAYNAGPIAVNRWLDHCRGCALDEFVESIPFTETRRYVRSVMANFANYQRVYSGKATLPPPPPLPERLPEGEEIF